MSTHHGMVGIERGVSTHHGMLRIERGVSAHHGMVGLERGVSTYYIFSPTPPVMPVVFIPNWPTFACKLHTALCSLHPPVELCTKTRTTWSSSLKRKMKLSPGRHPSFVLESTPNLRPLTTQMARCACNSALDHLHCVIRLVSIPNTLVL